MTETDLDIIKRWKILRKAMSNRHHSPIAWKAITANELHNLQRLTIYYPHIDYETDHGQRHYVVNVRKLVGIDHE